MWRIYRSEPESQTLQEDSERVPTLDQSYKSESSMFYLHLHTELWFQNDHYASVRVKTLGGRKYKCNTFLLPRASHEKKDKFF